MEFWELLGEGGRSNWMPVGPALEVPQQAPESSEGVEEKLLKLLDKRK